MPSETLLACTGCRKTFRVPNYNPSAKYPCLNCGGQLVPTVAIPAAQAPDAAPPEVAAAAQDPANRVGRFVLVRELGSGAMGRVYRAWDGGLRRWVAIKMISGQGVSMDDLVRFRREAKLAAALDHPNIATVYDLGESGGRHYIVMKLVEGRTLDRVFAAEAGKAPDTRAVVAAIRDACRGVAYAHAMHVIHRDLKPANMMMDRDGRVFVMDFGLAKSLMVPGVTSAGSFVFLGTPAYMSPEAARGMAAKLDARADVFSLGASLFALLAGRHLHPASDAGSQLQIASSRPAPRLRSVRADLPADLDDIVARATAPAKELRFHHAGELAEALDRWLSAAPEEKKDAVESDRALIVDDDAQVSGIVKILLEGMGLKPVVCGDGEMALAAARAGPAAVVVLDAGLPGKSGWDVLKLMREIAPYDRTPIVMLTGATAEDDVAKGFELGADDYVTKPFSNKEFKARVQRLLKRR